METVPEAIIAFLDSSNFETAIRLAVSLGGDTDTLTCITGGIAEAFYGMTSSIPETTISKNHLIDFKEETMKRLPGNLKKVVIEFDQTYSNK